MKFNFFAVFLMLFFFSGTGWSFEVDNHEIHLEKFFDHDENSNTSINHQPLTDYLQQVVFPVGRSKGLLGVKGKTDTYLRSNIKRGHYSPSRTEGNRIFIHAFTKEHDDFFNGYQKGLENLSNRLSLSTLNRDEQLAYWLNLYNVVVINKLIEEYPIQRLKPLRFPKGGKTSFWEQKVVTVEGVSLSLKDIEAVLFQNYDTPLVIYGLWQGSIGGPSLPNQSFTGETAWEILQKNAVEFVNSNRGVRPKGNRLKISLIYDWFSGAFQGPGDSILSHIYEFADPAFLGDITNMSRVEPAYFDWVVADILGGVLHTGWTSKSALIDEGVYRIHPGKSPRALGLPPQALDLVQEIARFNDVPDRVPLITTEECAPGETCGVEDENP